MRLQWKLVVFLLLAACTAAGTIPLAARLLGPHDARLSRILSMVYGQAAPVDGGRITQASPTAADLPENWRRAEANLFLSDEGPAQADARFFIPGQGARETWVKLHYLAPRALSLTISCDADARFTGLGAGSGGRIRAGRTQTVTLPNGADGRARLELGPDVQTCELGWGAGRKLTLVREEAARPDLARLDNQADLCTAPNPTRLDPLEQAFYADRWLSQSCVMQPGPVRFLEDGLDSLNARMEALTGRRLSQAELMSGDVEMPLDFSNAPALDLIYVSYLLIRADFSGYLLARALEHHAARGTVVRILVAGSLMQGKERAYFGDLAARFPNIQIQYYQWTEPGNGAAPNLIDRVHRSHHIKVFATLARDARHSRFITGGRNWWDGFFYETPFDLADHPEFRNYADTAVQALVYYSTYKDFEIELRGDAVIRNLAAHFSTFWHRDAVTQVARPMAVHAPAPQGRARGGMRHFMSLPWADARAQEVYFTELLDAAEREIVLVSAFIYPPDAIMEALLRAQARGVRVRIVVRLRSTDPSGVFVSSLNHNFTMDWADRFEIYAYRPDPLMMHTKLILIDGRLSVVTSTNLNRRSFLHDTENGVVFLDPGMTARLQRFVDGYIADSTRIEPGEEARSLDQFMRAIKGLWQFF